MPIPALTLEGVLPPYAGPVGAGQYYSPYETTLLEICQRWNTSQHRRMLLSGLLNFRSLLRGLGHVGFQWVDGSFVENCELVRGRPPDDIDVVTFYTLTSPASTHPIFNTLRPVMMDETALKRRFHVHHLPVNLGTNPYTIAGLRRIVKGTSFWTQMFSHRRDDNLWKGMLQVDLMDVHNDTLARSLLNGSP